MKILVLDNYDSFVYNLVHYLRELGQTVDIYRNDKITLKEVGKYDKILLSPGPGIPSEAGIMPDLLKTYGETKSILGVCLGHQAIGEAFGATLENNHPLHGVQDSAQVVTPEAKLFQGIPNTFKIGHYHSWVINSDSLAGTQLKITARDENGFVMAVQHNKFDVQGVQFHPESVLTEHGMDILKNWVQG
ncbi:anthranilate synthase component II [Flammeovirga kamogawensis]|uniref:Aminodeoxychorismate/anthranilate synthase component II n=1 Tax=Flammeovirga kamogawensis TaxID=373891 RepID=A0ABX8GR10_9BACT|nr:aminodeoxychorismate/anthranilate synthase component II [Flammeovirga kamogawensis]MBB6462149.1 anthranilate synthase component 2 [Flammeovirga kamogawensis]QWG05883.1 aminodeoxychorismate/anthranilate synthase component II [Flammeovirga kamogawensis]TRX67707.1 aminodeoxychorismate/anthranilate synthase component II [Flammeovirga kamogawensis]